MALIVETENAHLALPTQSRHSVGCCCMRYRQAIRTSGIRSISRNVERFRGGLVCKAHELLYRSTLGSRVIKKKIWSIWVSPGSLPLESQRGCSADPACCEDRIGTGPPLARTEVVYVDLGYWAISGSIHPRRDPASWGMNSSVFRHANS